MRKLSIWFTLVLGAGAIALAVIARLNRYTSPDPTIETKVRLRSVAQASQAFHNAYKAWPTGFAQFYPDHNPLHLAFLQPGVWATNDAWGHSFLYRPFNSAVGHGSVLSLGLNGRSNIEETFQ